MSAPGPSGLVASALPGLEAHLRSAFSGIGPLGIAGIALAVVAVVTYTVLRLASRRSQELVRLIEPYRLEQLRTASGPVEQRSTVVTLPFLRRASGVFGRGLGRTRLGRRFARLLRRADVPVELGELAAVWLVAAVALVALGAIVGGPAGAGVALLLVLAAPPIVLTLVVDRRERRFAEQLPDVLRLTASSLRAGFSFAQSLDGVVRQLRDPARRELQQVISEVRLGRVLEEALQEAADRIQNRDFSEAVMAVRIQQETGGNLAALLDVLANTMTQRVRMRREVRSLTAEGRISAYVLGLLPVAIGLFIYASNRAYIAELFHTGPGEVALIGGAVLEAHRVRLDVPDREDRGLRC